jgi:cell division septation protein DedD
MSVANVALQASTEPVELPQPTSSDSPALLDFADNGEPEEEHVIRIKMSWVRNIAAIAAAVIAFFVMATPIANSDLRTRAMSDLKGNLLYKLIPQDTNMAPATPIAESVQQQTAEPAEAIAKKEVAETVRVAEKADSTAKPKATATATDKTYCIVLASHVRKDNAETYVEKLKKQGYNAEIYVHKSVVRVVYGSYKTEAEAYKQLNRLTDKEEFFDAWVYKKAES